MREASFQARDLYSEEAHLPYFRLGYPEVFRRMNSEPFTIPSVPSFPLVELGKRLNGAKIFELASVPGLGQSDTSDPANALRFIPEGDLTRRGNISAQAPFHLPPLTEDLLLFTNIRH
jgi:hypothetical protein